MNIIKYRFNYYLVVWSEAILLVGIEIVPYKEKRLNRP
jgi:hypothetical protein